MVIGYSLGNRNDLEEDIQVIGEDDPNVITFSGTLPIVLSRTCRNQCPYCGFAKKDNLTVPYSTIRMAKAARTEGVREALYVVGDRPDQSAHIRSLLDLWGFSTYLDYVYTVCELGFLEGLIPVLEAGFLSPLEMKRLSEVCAAFKIMLDSVDAGDQATVYAKSPGKKIDTRLKLLDWAGKLKIPTITGVMVGTGESKSHRGKMFEAIGAIHKEHGTIHEVLIQNFVPSPRTAWKNKNAPDKSKMLEAVEQALSILPSDISVTVPLELNPNIEDFIRAGVRDLGRLYTRPNPSYPEPQTPIHMDTVYEVAEKLGFKLQQRFALKKNFIKNGFYSKKLGQVFDSYRYKIKKEGVEKVKEVRA